MGRFGGGGHRSGVRYLPDDLNSSHHEMFVFVIAASPMYVTTGSTIPVPRHVIYSSQFTEHGFSTLRPR